MTLALSVRNTLAALPAAQESVATFLATHAVAEGPAYAVRLAIEELVSNTIRHGYTDRSQHEIRLTVRLRGSWLELTFVDDAVPFDPNGRGDLPQPDTLETTPTSGMGIAMVRSMAGPMIYQRIGGQNHVTLRIAR